MVVYLLAEYSFSDSIKDLFSRFFTLRIIYVTGSFYCICLHAWQHACMLRNIYAWQQHVCQEGNMFVRRAARQTGTFFS